MPTRFSSRLARWTTLLATLTACAVLCGSGPLTSAISRDHGWALAPAGTTDGVMIHHLPAGGAWGEVRPGVRLPQQPLAITAIGDEFIFIPARAAEAAPVLGVRSTRVRQLPNGIWQYDRHRILPPIPLTPPSQHTPSDQTGDQSDDQTDAPTTEPTPEPTTTLIGFGAAQGPGPEGRILVALLQTDAQRTLMLLARDGWRAAPLPEALTSIGSVHLVATDRTIAIAQRRAAGELRVWSTDAASLLRATEPNNPQHTPQEPAQTTTHDWQAWTTPIPTGDFQLHGIDGQLVLVSGIQGDGKRRIALLRPSRSQPIAELPEQPGTTLAITGVGTGGSAAIIVVGFPTEPQTTRGGTTARPRVWVWSLAGVSLYDGQTVAITPVSLEQVGLLGLLLISLFTSILVFIVRPAATWNPPINLPEGASLAPPGRRLLAFVLDIVPGMFASSVLFPTGIGTGPLEPLGGLGPLLFVILITITHTTITEAWVGRTLGKLTMGLRTINTTGSKPSPHQALLRSIVKVICPPLMVFTLTNPYMPGPAGFGTVVVVDDWRRDPGANANGSDQSNDHKDKP